MKTQIITIFIFISAFTSFSQNKKEQLEVLNVRIDSCKAVISTQSSELNSKQLKIAELEQKLAAEQKNSEEKAHQITLLNKELASLKNKNEVAAIFTFKVITQVENRDARVGTDSETEVYLMIQNQRVDTYSEYGDPELDSSNRQIYLNSEMSEKSYEIVSITPSKVLVKRSIFCSDCVNQESELIKEYQKDVSGKWNYSSCSGDCEE